MNDLIEAPHCPLCLSNACTAFEVKPSSVRYLLCENCDLRFMHPADRLNASEEKERYDLHRNHLEDEGYQNFVKPLIDEIKIRMPHGAHGLDFGSGPAPIAADLLQKAGYRVELYDPYFCPDAEVLNKKFDFVAACEVVEHFYDPLQSFKQMTALLKPDGVLGFMTSIHHSKIDFNSWHYRRDPTHVSFYSEKTLVEIAKQCGLVDIVFAAPRTVTMRKPKP